MIFFTTMAAQNGIHISLRAEPIVHLGVLEITNSIIYGIISACIIGGLLVWAARRIKITSQRGFTQIVEILVEYIINLLTGPLGSRKNATRYAPIFGVYFLFIIGTNILALSPLVGPGLSVYTAEGRVPLFRPFTADLNGTIALSLIAIVLVQILSIRKQGSKNHLKHYFSDKPLNPINFFIGVLELLGELTRVLSLSLRLFLNTAVGEILIAIFTSMVIANGRTPFISIPIVMFEMLVAGIQAYVFTILCATYLGLAVSHAHNNDDDHHSIESLNLVEGRAKSW